MRNQLIEVHNIAADHNVLRKRNDSIFVHLNLVNRTAGQLNHTDAALSYIQADHAANRSTGRSLIACIVFGFFKTHDLNPYPAHKNVQTIYNGA